MTISNGWHDPLKKGCTNRLCKDGVDLYYLKYGNEHGKERAWGRIVESVRKDIECNFGTLKGQWIFLKTWNKLSRP